mmetsp:Transcript_27071/g.37365  ORF Transcript_27071/g.37365 Transcript_27071/m.37365 type:complete len:150 (-) Transcript_27071:178-627(-)
MLYKRFRELDKGHKGYISSDELLNVPELSLNPLAKRMAHLFENVNFNDFVATLANFSDRSTQDEKLRFMFAMHDTDGDNYISKEDLDHTVRTLCGSNLTEAEVASIVKKVMMEVVPKNSSKDVISFEDFQSFFCGMNVDPKLNVKVPEF